MVWSSILMGAIGISLEFFPHEVLNSLQTSPSSLIVLFVQITGALYLGFALMNWMAKAVLIGGIYARPLAIGNFLHFVVGAFALIKFGFDSPAFQAVWLLAVAYVVGAILFGYGPKGAFPKHPMTGVLL